MKRVGEEREYTWADYIGWGIIFAVIVLMCYVEGGK